MKVILLQDIENLGKKYEIKEVKDGHARNLLIPQKLAKAATKEALKWLADQKEVIEKEAVEDLAKAQALASAIDGLEVAIMVKIGDEGQLFESINAQKISEKLKEMGHEVKKSQILLKDSIKEIGEFPVKVNLEHNLEVEIKVIITGEENAKEKEE